MLVSTLTIASAFVLGVVVGFWSVVVYGLVLMRRFDKKKVALTKKLNEETKVLKEKAQSAKERVNKAFDIAELQFNIISGLEGPQNSPLHGKHKQQMNAELKKLEEEKMSILKSVLADGHDFKLTILNQFGEKESIRLSEFINQRETEDMQESSAKLKVEPPKRKLSIVKNNDKENQ